MGVDFLVCSACSDTFPDCGKYVVKKQYLLEKRKAQARKK